MKSVCALFSVLCASVPVGGSLVAEAVASEVLGDPFWGNGAAAPLVSEGMARGWNWEKAQCGNTHPGALVPYGWVSVCPYSGGYSSGYGRYSCSSDGPTPELFDRSAAYGISHFHNSGTGWIGSFYNYFLLTPYLPGRDVTRASDLVDEQAEPGWYAAEFRDYGTRFELTATPFAACHRFRFPGGKGVLRLDTTAAGLSRSIGVRNYQERIDWGDVRRDAANEWHGYNFVRGTNLRFRWKVMGKVVAARNDAGVITLEVEGETVESVIGFSLISSDEARSRAEEAASKGFSGVEAEARAAWQGLLGRVRADFMTARERRAFYGALYQSMIKPCDYGGGFVDFATLWDQYRTAVPVLLTFSREKARPLAEFVMRMIKDNGSFPIQYSMDRNLKANSGQASSLAVYVLADAFWRGVLTAEDYPRLKAAFDAEFAAADVRGKSPTFVLDVAGAYHAASEVARACGDVPAAEGYAAKAEIWRDVYDAKTGYLATSGSFYEGNCRNYSFRPHVGMRNRVALAGGEGRFCEMLDDFFCVGYEPDPTAPAAPCRRKGIADYMPEFEKSRPLRPGYFEGLNNESDMDAPFAYLWCGRADRLAEVVDVVRRCRFTDGKGGCPGNNDSGSLSSWYVWSCLGLYPLSGTPYVLLVAPSVTAAEIDFSKGRLVIRVDRESPRSIYPVGYSINGRKFLTPAIRVDVLSQGGELVFFLKDKPEGPSPIPTWL